jgi:glycine betaine/proline transport system permease protein
MAGRVNGFARSLVLATLALCVVLFRGDTSFVGRFPVQAQLALAGPLDRLLKFIATDFTVGPFSLSAITRVISAALATPLDFLVSWLSEGTYVALPGGSELELSQLPWIGVASVLALVAALLGGLRGTVLTLSTLAFVYVLGLWASTMTTLVSVFFAVVIAVVIGVCLGILAAHNDWLSRLLAPLYDAIQTVPIFSYLALMLIFFGFGAVTALIATVIFAVAPMARLTELSLRQLPQTVGDLTTITGCSTVQRLLWAELPAARHGLLLGINQVTMLSLSMVIIASIIGAGGLGNDVLRGLKSLRLTDAFLAGLAISLIAITIDRTLRIWINRESKGRRSNSELLLWAGAMVVMLTIAGYFVEALHYPPDRAIIDVNALTAEWSSTSALTATLLAMRDGFVTWILLPFRNFFANLPWLPLSVLAGVAAFIFTDRTTAVASFLLLLAIALLGLWDKAMLSLYLVVLSLIVAFVIALPLGLLFGLNRKAYAIMETAADLIQTLPSFIYLIPVVVLFGAGDFPAFLAIITYLLAPIVRYNAHAVQQVVFGNLTEVVEMAGTTLWQRMIMVYLPVASPQILLGINQAVMLAFSMLVITALVGSRGLEETTLVAIAQVKPGLGIIAGFGIASLAIVMDRILRGVSRKLSVSGTT